MVFRVWSPTNRRWLSSLLLPLIILLAAGVLIYNWPSTAWAAPPDPDVTVTSPNGGEYWAGGSSRQITWTATDDDLGTTPITIDYYDGSQWISIATNEANDGTYTWMVSNLNTSSALVRVIATDLLGHTGSDQSDASFIIDSILPTVTVTSPNGGEYWAGGSSHAITWTASDTYLGSSPITLQYYSGSSWVDIATNEANDGGYSWTVPNVNTSLAKVRVIATDLAGNSGSDDSNGNFTIDSTSPSVAVTSPNSGECWAGGSSHDITWTASDANMASSPITIEYYNGSSWVTISTGEDNDGSYTWTVPSLNISNASVRITAIDLVSHTSTDQSNSNFAIDSTNPTITLTSPNGGEYWAGNSSRNITWTASDTNFGSGPILVEYYNASSWVTVATNESNDGTYTWTVPYINIPTARVRVTATDRAGHTASDGSDSTFYIDSTNPTITVTSPNGGEYWAGSSSHAITWTASDSYMATSPITLEYYNGSSWVTIATGESNDGTYTWTVPNLNISTAKVRATATDRAANTGVDESNGNFTIDSTVPTVTITSPNGGEYWAGASSHAITWTASDSNFGSTPITLEYYNGSSWVSIATGEANDGTYTWTVPSLDISTAQVRITAVDLVGNSTADVSNSTFIIDSTNPTITVTSPNGGEYWAGNSSQSITWTASDTNLGSTPIALQYFNGSSWITIATSEANDGTYTWTVPLVNTSAARVRVTVTDQAGNSANDTSDSNFTIDSTNPSVTVTSPNGGEYWVGGSSHSITWTATDTNLGTTPVTIQYYNGSSWVTVATGEANDGTYSWTVPSLDISTAKVRIAVVDLASNSGSDESNSVFAIDSTNPTVTVTSPNGGEYWQEGTAYAITWTASDTNFGSTPITLQYYDGSTWVTIATGEANDGTYSWTFSALNYAATRIRATAVDQAGNTTSDDSDSTFTLDGAPAVTVTSPNGAECWRGGSSHAITWTASDFNIGAGPITLAYYNGSAWVTIATGEDNDGTYSWTVPNLNISTARVRVTAIDMMSHTGTDQSDSTFTIDSTNPSVTVTSPNGGEYWAGGSSHAITWTATDANMASIPITIEYYNGSSWVTIATGEANDGTYTWTVPNLNISTARVRVSAIDQAGNTGTDQSDSTFTIDTTSPAVTVTSPNGGEYWVGGSSHVITWTATDANFGSTPVSIQYYNGSSWVTVATAEANDGTYIWTVPTLNISTARVRVTATDLAGNSSNDQSDSNFVIDSTAPVVTVTSPNGGEYWVGGSSHAITWTATDANMASSPITIEYYNDSAWTTIATGEANDGTYTWTVPTLDISTARIRVSAIDLAGNSGTDQSNSLFTIDSTNPAVTVTSPNGGEYLAGGSSYSITWSASDTNFGSNAIAIEYYNGSSWILVASNEANDGTYTWTVPTINISTALVRITATDLAGNSSSDQSNGTFAIDSISPLVIITSPTGGEAWMQGTSHNITWTATDANMASNPITIEYYNGSSWVTIATVEANDGIYSWTVPAVYVYNARIRVTAVDLAGNSGNAQSNVFTLDCPPIVTVTSPAGGEYWAGGSSHNITWTATDGNFGATPITIAYYNGSSWILIATNEANDGTYTWTVPSLDISNAQVRITAIDLLGNSTTAYGSVFCIDSADPIVTVTSPNGGENWTGGSCHNITWTATDANMASNPITIEYYNGSSWVTVAIGEANDGTYTWVVPCAVVTSSARIRVTAVDLAGNSSSDESDGTFTIDDVPSVQVTSPNGGEYWAGGSIHAITWTASDSNLGSGPITIEYYNGSSWVVIVSGEANDGTYSWTVPLLNISTAKVRVTATDLGSNSGSDQSDASFTIDSIAPVISLTSPQGGEYWAGGSSHDITWTASDVNLVTSPITIEYYNGSAWVTVATNEANDGSYSWLVPNLNLSNALIRVTATDLAGNQGVAYSINFTIDSTPPTVQVTRPNGGEEWSDETSQTITWTAADANFGAVPITIEYYDGSSWHDLSASYANSGSYIWTIPAMGTGNAKVRITASDLAGNSTTDDSDAPFVIDSAPLVRVISPNGGEYWASGTYHDITWGVSDANLVAHPITIQYYDGSSWITIAEGEDNDGSYTWLVPQLNIDSIILRISALDDRGNIGVDDSDSAFAIDSTIPSAPTGLTVEDRHKVGEETTVTLRWSEVQDSSGVSYILEVDDDSDFSSPIIREVGLTEASCTLVLPSGDGTYYWRVKAVDGAGNETDWSAEKSFNTTQKSGSPLTVVLIIVMVALAAAIILLIYRRRRNRLVPQTVAEVAPETEVTDSGPYPDMDVRGDKDRFFAVLAGEVEETPEGMPHEEIPEAKASTEPLQGQVSAMSARLMSGKTGDRTVDRQIDETVGLIDAGFEEGLWIDEAHLDSKRGDLVFTRHRTAIEHVLGIISKLEWTIPYLDKMVAQSTTDSLVARQDKARLQAMVTLMPLLVETVEFFLSQSEEIAAIAIREAEDSQSDNSLARHAIESAHLKFNQGRDVENDTPDRAVLLFGLAWRHAQAAIEVNTLSE